MYFFNTWKTKPSKCRIATGGALGTGTFSFSLTVCASKCIFWAATTEIAARLVGLKAYKFQSRTLIIKIKY